MRKQPRPSPARDGAAHDLANELTSLVRLAELALERLAPDHPARADVEAIRRSGLQCATLVRELLTGGRAPSGSVDLAELVTQEAAMFRRLHGQRIRFVVDGADRATRVRLGVADARRVLDNLILNALDAMPKGGELTLRVAGGGNGHAALEVRDTGAGMDAATAARVFEPSFTTKRAGTGLGLAVVRRIIERAGGSIDVKSEPGAGTAFRIRLPLAPEPAAGSGTILLVDDQVLVRHSVRQVLEESGYEVVEASDGRQALARLSDDVDLMLTDLALPDMDGTDLVAAAQRRHPGLKVVYMSGYSGARGAVGADEYLAKPAAPDELRERIGALLG